MVSGYQNRWRSSYPERFPWKVTALLFPLYAHALNTLWVLLVLYKKKANRRAINNLFFFLFNKMLEIVSVFLGTQISSPWKRNSQAVEDSGVFIISLARFIKRHSLSLLSTMVAQISVFKHSHRTKVERVQARWAFSPGIRVSRPWLVQCPG